MFPELQIPIPRRGTSLLAGSLALLALAPPASSQTRVDLRSRQTATKDQGSRTTCIVFAAIAGLEAAYKRAGYGDLDLSEEFCNYMGKMQWLHPNWNDPNGPAPRLGTKSASFTENQLGAWGGGNGSGYVKNLRYWLRVPAENAMPYRPSGYTLPYRYGHPAWQLQKVVNDVNLDPRNLPRSALTQSRYYGVRSFGLIANPGSPTAIESALRSGYEIVWDFHVRGTTPTNGTWRPASLPYLGAHSMLIVGYDRSSSNPANHYFICKNSWGPTGARSDGFTYISYDYLKQNGYSAGFIRTVTPPGAWNAAAFLGRWNLCFDGHRGTLDIYHIPGASQAFFNELGVPHTDRRIGTFRDSSGKMHRVNGTIVGKRLEFWFRGSYSNMSWSDTRDKPFLSRRFVYTLVDTRKGEMAGWHMDNAGSTPQPAYGGYARIPSSIHGTDGYLRPVFDNSQANGPNQYLGSWRAVFDESHDRLSIQKRNDYAISAYLRRTYYALEGEVVETNTGARRPLLAIVRRSRPSEIQITFHHTTRGQVKLTGFMPNFQRGVIAGDAVSRASSWNSFYAYREGAADQKGTLRFLGSSCSGSNGLLNQTVFPVPFLGRSSTFLVTRGPLGGRGILALGTSRSNLLFPGTPCWLRIAPSLSIPFVFGKTGSMLLSARVPNQRNLLGARLYSQAAAFDPGANAAGLTLSQGLEITIGGFK